jgi:hypothetical protein
MKSKRYLGKVTVSDRIQVCQIFPDTIYQNGEKYVNQINTKLRNDRKYMKRPYIFHSKALQSLPQLGFFGLKIYHLATLIVYRKQMCFPVSVCLCVL